MKDDYLTLRLPRELARALARWARDHDLPKSQVVREAVARYLAPGRAGSQSAPRLTVAEFLRGWAALPRLTPDEARDLAEELAAARRRLPGPPVPWA